MQILGRLARLLFLRARRSGRHNLPCIRGILDEVGGRGRCRRQIGQAQLRRVSNTVQANVTNWERERTSLQIVRSSSHIRRGRMFFRNGRLTSASWISSSASRGCSGKLEACVLQVLMAQVRKLRVRSFIVVRGPGRGLRGLRACARRVIRGGMWQINFGTCGGVSSAAGVWFKLKFSAVDVAPSFLVSAVIDEPSTTQKFSIVELAHLHYNYCWKIMSPDHLLPSRRLMLKYSWITACGLPECRSTYA